MSRIVSAVLSVALVFVFTSTSFAFDYNESISGDLNRDDPLTIMPLTPGSNSISGVLIANLGINNDWDSFAFTVPAGYSVSLISVTGVDVGRDVDSSAWTLYSGSLNANTGTFIGVVGATYPGTINSTLVPLSAGDYTINAIDQQGFGTDAAYGGYTFNINVVPEPASLSLIGLAGFGLIRRRR